VPHPRQRWWFSSSRRSSACLGGGVDNLGDLGGRGVGCLGDRGLRHGRLISHGRVASLGGSGIRSLGGSGIRSLGGRRVSHLRRGGVRSLGWRRLVGGALLLLLLAHASHLLGDLRGLAGGLATRAVIDRTALGQGTSTVHGPLGLGLFAGANLVTGVDPTPSRR
jgi:hypothetical protein